MDKKIVIIANERVGYKVTEQAIEKGYNVAAVFTSHASRRQKIADYIDFGPLEKKYSSVPFHFIADPKNPDVIGSVRSRKPDLILVISWSQILPKELVELAPLGTIGVHYSLLPERRGGAPLVWAIIDGLKNTGLTLFYYDTGIDTGDMIDQVEIAIKGSDTVKTMLDKVAVKLPELVFRNLDAILQGRNKRMKQDGAKATYTKPRTPKDGAIDWTQSDKKIHDFIRAQTHPYPCAFTKITDKDGKEKKLVIPKSRLINGRLIIEGFIEK